MHAASGEEIEKEACFILGLLAIKQEHQHAIADHVRPCSRRIRPKSLHLSIAFASSQPARDLVFTALACDRGVARTLEDGMRCLACRLQVN